MRVSQMKARGTAVLERVGGRDQSLRRCRRDRRDYIVYEYVESRPSCSVPDWWRKKAVERGAHGRKPWVKTSLAPGSKVVTDYLARDPASNRISTNWGSISSATVARRASAIAVRFPDDVAHDRRGEHDMIVAAVLSGNRNFEGRIHPQVRANYLASPPLVVAYALAGRMDVDLDDGAAGRRIRDGTAT